jgi:hypothetical protein
VDFFEMKSQFFAKLIAAGAISEQKSTISAKKIPEYEGEKPKAQVFKQK